MAVLKEVWNKAVAGIEAYYTKLRGVPAPLKAQLDGLKQRLA